MPWGSAKNKVANPNEDVYFSAIDGLKKIYFSKIKPVEDAYKYRIMGSPALTEADFDARPQVMLMGQYSVGKTSFIRYVIEKDFPGSHIGPEPTTDRFMAVMHGDEDRITPGNALAVQEDKPFRALTKFGTQFLNKLECSSTDSPVLKSITLIDTPGVLAGSKQTLQRGYDFEGVIEWFAEKSDLILLLFDAHKLDISDEFKRTIVSIKPHDEKVRVVLNKADSVSQQALMRVYGAMMWSLGKVTQTPEVKRVFISSFWDEPFKHENMAELFEQEREDLFNELRSLPRNAVMRKINELVKRARGVKVHAMLIGHLRAQMPSMWGHAAKQKELLQPKNMANVFRAVQKEFDLPMGDFPDMKKFCDRIADMDFSKFPKTDLAMINAMDEVLSRDIPKLMNEFPPEQEMQPNAKAQVSPQYQPAAAAPAPAPAMPPQAAAQPQPQAPPAMAADAGNPFGGAPAAPVAAPVVWDVDETSRATYGGYFKKIVAANGKADPGQARELLMKSQLGMDALKAIWNMSDVDKDGFLDEEEFILAMYLCMDARQKGGQVASALAPGLIPPSKR